MNKNDYRNTSYCKELKEISHQKEKLKKIIRKNNHPRTKNFYEIIRNEYKKEYLRIYNYKCSYCGASIDFIDYELFEIDHYKNKASCSNASEGGALENLVLACRTCNRSKGGLEIRTEYLEKLQPDNEEIKKIFYRADNYEIKIKAEYSGDLEIYEFYKRLKLNYEFRKLDFLLLNLKGLYDKVEEQELKDKLGSLKDKIKSKRSLINKITE